LGSVPSVPALLSKATLESTLAGVVAAIFCYSTLISPVTLAALAMRRRMPDAWFSSSIVLYATGIVLAASLAIAGVVYRIVYKQTGGTVPRP
jgi:hypothetical protein